VTVQKGFAFRQQPIPADSSGDGASSPSHFNPWTGCENTGYQQPEPPSRLSTTGALGDETAHGDVAEWQRCCGQPGGMSPGITDSGASGYGIGGEGGSRFVGSAYNGSETGSDRSGYGIGIAGEGNFSSHGCPGSDVGSDTSGYGKGIGNSDPLRRSNQI
jgi:hypothetical protein